jgi:hypothetical protein
MSSSAFGFLQVLTRLSEDFKQTKLIFKNDPPDQFFLDQNFLAVGGLAQIRDVPNGASDLSLSLGELTSVKMLVLFSDGPITVKTAVAGDTGQPIGDTNQPGVLVVLGAGITAILVSNASGADVKVRYYVAG